MLFCIPRYTGSVSVLSQQKSTGGPHQAVLIQVDNADQIVGRWLTSRAHFSGPGTRCNSYWIQHSELLQQTITLFGRTDYPAWVQLLIATGKVAAYCCQDSVPQ